MAAVGKSSGPNCLLCTELISDRKGKSVDEDKSQQNSKFLYGANATANDLKSQLSVFFLLRKVLSLPQDFLETLLTQCGSPSEWSIQLCRHCTRLYTEAEYLWDRLKRLQMDFDKVSNEIKDVISGSILPDEEKFKDKNGVTKKSLVGSKLKPSQVSDCVRKTFFLNNNSNTKLALKDASNTKSESFGSNLSIEKSSQSTFLNWNEKGVPYLALVDFENKMKKLVESVVVTQTSQSQAIVPVPVQDQKPLKEASTQTLDVPGQSSPAEFISVENNDNDNEMEFELEGEDPLIIGDANPCNNVNVSNSTNVAINIPLQTPIVPSQPVVPAEPASAIRIVQTSTLMEPEEADNDNDAAPHVIGILKHDPDAVATIDLDSGDSLPDPLAINDDADDPDYVPDSPAVNTSSKPSTTNGPENKSEKKPEEKPSKFSSISIQPIKLQTNLYECSQCKETFDARVGCQSHILRDHYEDRKPFHCHVCSAKFALFPQLKEHARNLHGGITTPYDNDFNPATDHISFEMSKILHGPTEESESAYRTTIPVYDCPLCPQKFTVKRNVVRHAKTVHKATIPLSQVGLTKKNGTDDPLSLDNDAPTNHTFSCIECDQRNITFTATTPEALEVHRRRHHRGNNGSTSIQKKIRVNVIRKPPEPRKQNMSCPDCKKMLPTITAMAEHLKHPENKCKQCSRHFLFDMDLRRHVEMEHTRGTSFQCPYCPKTFSAQIIYEKHIDNHQLHDVHECEFCQTKFTGFANLHRHMEIHADLIEQQQQQLQQDPLACD